MVGGRRLVGGVAEPGMLRMIVGSGRANARGVEMLLINVTIVFDMLNPKNRHLSAQYVMDLILVETVIGRGQTFELW